MLMATEPTLSIRIPWKRWGEALDSSKQRAIWLTLLLDVSKAGCVAGGEAPFPIGRRPLMVLSTQEHC